MLEISTFHLIMLVINPYCYLKMLLINKFIGVYFGEGNNQGGNFPWDSDENAVV